ncbi:MAG: ATP-binding cassette domain-containing protein [Bradyrhizobiaceae bacterium]|nr:ATP-binding cassette domain-containing protein [Bradyrhizobiaceae bacterium]
MPFRWVRWRIFVNVEQTRALHKTAESTMIQLRGITKSFGAKTVLKGIDLAIPTGSTMCIIGRSGCGKSVLLKHIVGLLKADAGDVEIDGRNVRKLSRHDLFALRQRIGYVFQGAALFDSMTVKENVTIGMVEHGVTDAKLLDSEACRVLSAVGLLPPVEEYESAAFQKEYAIIMNKKPSDLSGGMRKRVGVARALVGRPDYIFYDEPTTGLDPVTSQQIDDLIGVLARNLKVTSIVITHDMFSVFNVADRVAMIHEGVVRFEGTVPELRDTTDTEVTDFLSRYVAEGF